MNMELQKKAEKIIMKEFEGDLTNTKSYVLTEEGKQYIIISQKHTELCVMFDPNSLEMVGLQPLDYVQQYGELL